ncbi:hypothetical protein V1509DRAFT_615528 [Lipomyces kononenkoae]
MDSSSDSYLEIDDEVYLCKRCDKVLEEGRAFELGGNRWHVECFRCSSCDAQLDCDTNLLVLGNGDLICGNCCYSCCVCGKKIDDLAILTGKDTAFCAKCFKCRNCKRPIENLRYARTSQGIFCMSCNDKLIERRRRNKLKEQQGGPRRARANPHPTSTITNITTESTKDDSIPVAVITTVLERKDEHMSITGSAESNGRRSASPPVRDKMLPPVPMDGLPQNGVPVEERGSKDTPPTDTVTQVTASTEVSLTDRVSGQEAWESNVDSSTVNGRPSSPSAETILRRPTVSNNSGGRHSITTSAILDTYRDSYMSSASSAAELHSERTIRAVPTDNDDSPSDTEYALAVVASQGADPAGSVKVSSTTNAENVSHEESATQDSAHSGHSASIRSDNSNGSSKNDSRRASISSIASTSTFSSFTRSSKGFLSDITSRRSKPSSLTSKVRRISRSIMIDSSTASGSHTGATPPSGTSFVTAGTPSSDVSVKSDFSFPLRRQSMSPAISQQPLSAPPESVQQRLQPDDGEALSLVPTPSSLSLIAPGNETSSTSTDQPQSLSSTDNGNTPRPDRHSANTRKYTYSSMLIDDDDVQDSQVVNKDQGQRSVSSTSTGASAPVSNSKNSFARSHSVSLSQASTESTYTISGGSIHQKRSPFLFSGQFGAKQKDSATTTKDRSATAISTLKKLGDIAKASNPKSPPRTPEKTATGLWTETAEGLSPAPEISSSPVVRISTDGESEFGESKASDSNYIPLPRFQENMDFSLEEDFKNILNSQDQLAQSSPRSPRSPSRGVGVRTQQRFPNIFRKTSRSTLRSVVAAGGDSTAATTYQTVGSPDSTNKQLQSSPYISPEDVPTFMMVANERSSVLDADENDYSELSPTRIKAFDADGEEVKLKYELVRASQRIVELEAMLKIGEPDTNALEKTIEERRRTIADLEAQTTLVRKEFEVMRGGQAAAAESDETPDEVLQRFRDEMDATKNGLQAEIQDLISQRNELLDENLRLTKLRDDAVQLAEQLNSKNQQLSDLNNELTRQIQERFKTHKGSSPSIGSSSSGGGLFGNLRSHSSREQFSIDRDAVSKPTYLGRSRGGVAGNAAPANANPNVVAAEAGASGNISTVLEDATTEVGRPAYSLQPSVVSSGNSTVNGGGKKKFWQRGGVAVAKYSVKGFNKMFAVDGANASSQWSGSSNGTEHMPQEDAVATGGLNIVMPTSASASSGLSTLGNNLAKNGGVMRTIRLKGSNGVNNEPVAAAEAPESGLFGVDIVKRVELEGRPVPFIVTRCIQEVESRGMDFEGIYRKSGIKSQTDMIQSMFEKCDLGQTLPLMANEGLSSSSSTSSLSSASLDEKEKITGGSNTADVGMILTPEMIKWQDEFNELMQGDICSVTSALKQYLRHLPVPLVTYDSYTAFITVADQDGFERKIYSITRILNSLPQVHKDCLECIVRHLSRVMTHSDKNLMTSLNLAVVFAPTLAWDYTGTREMMDAHKRNEVIKLMIENSDRIFATDGPR